MQTENVNLFCQRLTDGRHGDDGDDDSTFRTLQGLKRSFSRNFGHVKLESILTHVPTFLVGHSGIVGSDLLLRYGDSLVNYLGRNESLDLKVIGQLEWVIGELKLRNETGANEMISRAWKRLVDVSLVHPPFAVFLALSCTSTFERLVLSFLEDPTSMDYYSDLSSGSPELFQRITSILNEVLIRSEGHEIVLRLIASFVGGVMSICQKRKNNYLGLYPPRFCRLVSLLFISPDLYSTEPDKCRVTRDTVLALIRDLYSSDRKCALLLLSHYQDWIPHFKDYIKIFP